jgi:hypothetical protein
MTTMIGYDEAIVAARGLLAEQINDPVGEANPEYTRGVVEIIADCFGVGVFMDDRKARVARDIGVTL